MRKSRGINTYSGAHRQVVRIRGLATGHICACGNKAHEWAYRHDNPCPDERIQRNMKFSLDPLRYDPMCRRCHRLYDKQHITSCPAGHEYTPDNTLTDAGKRKCKTCVYDRNRRRPLTTAQRARKSQLQRERRAQQRRSAA